MKVYDKFCVSTIVNNIDLFRKEFVKEKLLIFNESTESDRETLDALVEIADCEDKREECLTNQQHVGLERQGKNISDQEQQRFIFDNWHMDTAMPDAPHAHIPVLISMKMNTITCAKDLSMTLFVDSRDMLLKAPKDLVEWMQKTFIVNLMGYEPFTLNTYDHKATPLRAYPMISTHNLTRENSLLLPSSMYAFFPENKDYEHAYRLYVKDYLSNEDNWIKIEWEENKMIVWDNRSLLHSFMAGWQDDERVFTRYQVGFITPSYDIGSIL